mmetsp:Transcript_42666/g.122465  ORF Transcript_42666/g.122465 Transcript_42666/m.122465 type:complete len:348 (+) Transcript_42666:1147-2190(+)
MPAEPCPPPFDDGPQYPLVDLPVDHRLELPPAGGHLLEDARGPRLDDLPVLLREQVGEGSAHAPVLVAEHCEAQFLLLCVESGGAQGSHQRHLARKPEKVLAHRDGLAQVRAPEFRLGAACIPARHVGGNEKRLRRPVEELSVLKALGEGHVEQPGRPGRPRSPAAHVLLPRVVSLHAAGAAWPHAVPRLLDGPAALVHDPGQAVGPLALLGGVRAATLRRIAPAACGQHGVGKEVDGALEPLQPRVAAGVAWGAPLEVPGLVRHEIEYHLANRCVVLVEQVRQRVLEGQAQPLVPLPLAAKRATHLHGGGLRLVLPQLHRPRAVVVVLQEARDLQADQNARLGSWG